MARVLKRIVALYDPDRIYVFGSYAKGTLSSESDLDLLVVKATELPRKLRGRDVMAMLIEVPFKIDILFVTPTEMAEELADRYSLIATIMASARPVYQRKS